MPRADRPAADAATTEPTDPALDASEEQASAEPPKPASGPEPDVAPDEPADDEDGPQWGNWRFIDDGPLTYAAIPVTVRRGDVIVHLGAPAHDGRWEPTDEPVTRHPDNHRPGPEVAAVDNQGEEG